MDIERRRAYYRQWSAANRERIKAYKHNQKEWRRIYQAKNKDKINARNRGYYQADKPWKQAQARGYYWKDVQKRRLYKRQQYVKSKNSGMRVYVLGTIQMNEYAKLKFFQL